MHKRVICLILCFVLTMLSTPAVAYAVEDDGLGCYIVSSECPSIYTTFASENISKFILSLDEDMHYSSVSVGTPFSFADADADVYYFPVLCDGQIEYLFRVYPDGDSFSAAITKFLAADLERLAKYTSASNPMYLNLVGNRIIATIGSQNHILFEYPDDMSISRSETEVASISDYNVVNAKDSINIGLNLRETRDVYEYITLDLIETQSGNSWCSAYCLAAIIRTKTNYYTTAKSLMTTVLGSNPSTSTAFPWAPDSGPTMASVANQYGLSPTVLTTTASSSVLTAEINAGRPCIAAMTCSKNKHAVVLRGYSSVGTWGIWNPWFNYYENYSMNGSYVPTGYSSTNYSYTPYMHAYNFG